MTAAVRAVGSRRPAGHGFFELRRLLSLVLLLLVTTTYFLPRWADWNENSRLALVLSAVDDGSANIDKYQSLTGDFAFYNGHYYSDKAPGLALMAMPVYTVVRHVLPAKLAPTVGSNGALGATLKPDGAGLAADHLRFFAVLVAVTFVTVAVPSAILGVLVFLVARAIGLGPRGATATVLLCALATPAFPYANSFVGHQTAAALLFAAFALLFAIRRGVLAEPWLIAAGFLTSYAVVTEYPAGLIAGLIGLYALIAIGFSPRVLVRLAIGAVPPVIALAVYDVVSFGTILPIGYFHSTLWSDVHDQGFVSLTYPHFDAIWGITFGVHRGLFFLAPYLLFAVLGYVVLWRDRSLRPEFLVLLGAPVAFFLFNSSSAMWQGGFAVGPRYLVPSLPFLGLAAGLGLVRAWERVAYRPVVVAAAAWSFFAIWAETLAGQSFPDYTANPLFDLSLPRLAADDIARNVGMVLGLPGWVSLLPLLIVVSLIWLIGRTRPPSRLGGAFRPMAAEEGGPRWALR